MRWAGGTQAVRFGHRLLPVGGAAQRVDDAGELDEEPVAGGLDDAAAMLGDLRVDQLARIDFSRSRVPSSSAPIRRE